MQTPNKALDLLLKTEPACAICLTSSAPSGDFLEPYSVEAVMSVPAAPATAVVSALPSETRSLLPSALLLSPEGTVVLVT